MKSKTIVIKSKYLLFILIFAIVFFICSLTSKNNEKGYKNNTINYITQTDIKNIQKNSNQINYNKREAYKNIPENIDGYEVIGKLEIPKIELSTYILSETDKHTLNKSVTKLCGPNVNGVGNFCITGHNYNKNKMFKNLRKLEINDKIYITDIYDNKAEYIVYDIYKVLPNETECLSQDTNGEREITLITCTPGALKRLIVKAVELYD